MSAWLLVGIGVAVWLLSQRIPPPKDPTNIRFGWAVGALGIGILVMGVFAGVKGPVNFGSVSVDAFSFVKTVRIKRMDALNYARSNLLIKSQPAFAWKGASKSDLTCEVHNIGDRHLTRVTFSFMTKDNQSVNIKVRGPYPPKAKKSVLVPLPENVLRSYFSSGMSVNQISSASF